MQFNSSYIANCNNTAHGLHANRPTVVIKYFGSYAAPWEAALRVTPVRLYVRPYRKIQTNRPNCNSIQRSNVQAQLENS